MERKIQIRKQALYNRSLLTSEEVRHKSGQIVEQLIQIPEFLQAKIIYCYMDYRNEVETQEILRYAWGKGISIAIPRVKDQTMEFYKINSEVDLMSGYMGILEPNLSTIKVIPQEGDCMILPCVAFDKRKSRMGYGKGFYDRYLHKYRTNMIKIGIAFEIQGVSEIPTEQHDIPFNMIITESRVIK